jgi:hypothetical protein
MQLGIICCVFCRFPSPLKAGKKSSDVDAENTLLEIRRNQIGKIDIHKILLPLPGCVGSRRIGEKLRGVKRERSSWGNSSIILPPGSFFNNKISSN